jgi:outer membrane protein assembly factor BamE (lipoprotein component of BamABCDE complex)
MKFKKALVISAISLNMAACGLFIPMTQGERVDPSQFDKIQICKSNKSEVVEMFGEPSQRGAQSGYGLMTWISYKMMYGKPDTQVVHAFFNKNNLLVNYVVNPVAAVEINDQCK